MKRLVAAVGATGAIALAVAYGPALARYVAFGVLYGDWRQDGYCTSGQNGEMA